MSNCQRGVEVGDTTFEFTVQGGGGLANYAARMIALDRLRPAHKYTANPPPQICRPERAVSLKLKCPRTIRIRKILCDLLGYKIVMHIPLGR
jgi:hypothetical protein